MTKLNSEEIIKILEVLVGPVEPYGDTVVDMSRKSNLRILLGITDWCLDGILCGLEGLKSDLKSCQEIGNISKSVFEDYLKWIKERLDEYCTR